MGSRSSKPQVVYRDTGISQKQYDDLKKQLGDSNATLTKLQQSQAERDKARVAEQERMRKEMQATQARFASDKKAQEKAMADLRVEHTRRIQQLDRDRENDRSRFETQLSEVKKESEETMKKMTVEKLDQRREIMIRQLILERKEYDSFYDNYLSAAVDLSRLTARITAEESRLSKFMAVRHDPDCLRIILFGETGHGKSSVGCRLVGDQTSDFSNGGFAVSGDIQSVTQSIKGLVVNPTDPKVKHLQYSRPMIVVDMPGTGETRGKIVATQHSNRMIQYLKGIEFINCVGVVHSGTEPRMTQGTKDMLKSLVTAFGPEIWAHVILIITKVRSDYDFRDHHRMMEARNEIDRWIDQFRGVIRREFGVAEWQAELPVVKIDNKFKQDYTEKCNYLVERLAMKFLRMPFQCDKLSSELDDWRNEQVIKENEMNECNNAVKKSITVMNALIDELNTIDKNLSDKSADGTVVDLVSKIASMGHDISLIVKLGPEEVSKMIELEQQKVYSAMFDSAIKSYVVEDDDHKSGGAGGSFGTGAVASGMGGVGYYERGSGMSGVGGGGGGGVGGGTSTVFMDDSFAGAGADVGGFGYRHGHGRGHGPGTESIAARADPYGTGSSFGTGSSRAPRIDGYSQMEGYSDGPTSSSSLRTTGPGGRGGGTSVETEEEELARILALSMIDQ